MQEQFADDNFRHRASLSTKCKIRKRVSKCKKSLQTTVLDLEPPYQPNIKYGNGSKMQEKFAVDNLKFDEKCRHFSQRIENTAGKGEFARYEQILLFPQCVHKTCTADTQKPGLVCERLKVPIAPN